MKKPSEYLKEKLLLRPIISLEKIKCLKELDKLFISIEEHKRELLNLEIQHRSLSYSQKVSIELSRLEIENKKLKKEVQWLKDTHSDDIDDLIKQKEDYKAKVEKVIDEKISKVSKRTGHTERIKSCIIRCLEALKQKLKESK